MRPFVVANIVAGLALLAGCEPGPLPSPSPSTPTTAPAPEPATPLREADGTVKVGLLLPLSGDAAPIGADLLAAAQLALQDLDGAPLALLPKDTGGTAQGAGEAAQAVLAEGAGLILGPLFSQAVEGAAPHARARAVNVIALSNSATVAGDGVYILGYRPDEQVARVVGYAVDQGLSRIAGLGPRDAYGDLALDALRANIGRAGGELGPVLTYGSDTAEQADVIREAALGGGGAPFNAMLIADGGVQLRSVASLLGYYDLDASVVRYLGTMRWLSDPANLTDPYLQDAWLAAPDPTRQAQFAARFVNTFGREPHEAASLAYDATMLAAALADDPAFPAQTPALLLDAGGHEGAYGRFRLRADGLNQRALAVLAIEQGQLRVIDAPPASFDERFASATNRP
ncbi:MAG: penicillin-binding protein activator [Geminicoccaceae bacterium]